MSIQSLLPSVGSITNPKGVLCKVLFSREQLMFCHVQFSDSTEKVAAIAHEGCYYSMFKSVDSVQSVLKLVHKLSDKGNQLVITQAKQQYILWVQEENMTVISAQEEKESWATFKTASCLLFPENQPYKFIYLTTPDLTHRTPGFQYGSNYYSLLHREKDGRQAMMALAELACRGLELALIPMPNSYVICVLEPNASPT